MPGIKVSLRRTPDLPTNLDQDTLCDHPSDSMVASCSKARSCGLSPYGGEIARTDMTSTATNSSTWLGNDIEEAARPARTAQFHAPDVSFTIAALSIPK